MLFQYQALNNKGAPVSDFVDAANESAARQKIRGMGLYPVKIKKQDVSMVKTLDSEAGGIRLLFAKVRDKVSTRFSSKHIGLFSRQLGTLLKAGLPLPVAISDIVEQIDNNHFKGVIADVREKLHEGSSLSNAIQQHRGIFSDMYINMVRVGESLGSLDEVFERLAEMEEKKNILKSKIRAALWYPSFMFFFSICVVILLMVKVIPAIAEMFSEQNKNLPLPTEIVIFVSNMLTRYGIFILIIAIVGFYFLYKYIQTDAGRRKLDELKLEIPLVSGLYKKLLTYRFTQNLGVLLGNKVDIIKSFEIVEKIVNNIVIQERISEASKKIREGSSVAIALNKSGFLPKLVIGMITAGEASDKLDAMLMNIGRVYETEIDLTITGLTSLIEPIIIIFMGFIIGIIVMSVMLPIMEMNLLVG